MEMNIYQKLAAIQSELKAPKGQYNSFGKYRYRSCEDILEAVKPIQSKYQCVTSLSDEIVQIGDRYYVKATATLHDTLSESDITNTAYAREDAEKKGMDGSQITGTSSSYARKYALNGLFLIDDTKDADTDEFKQQSERKATTQATSNAPAYPTPDEMIKAIEAHYPVGEVRDKLLKALNVESVAKMSKPQMMAVYNKVRK